MTTTLCKGCTIVDEPGKPHDCAICPECRDLTVPVVGDILYSSWGYGYRQRWL